MKAFIRWVWVLCLFPPRVFGQAKLPITTSDHFVVEAPAVVQPGGETVDFIVGVEGSRFYTAYNMEIALPEDLVFVPNDKGNCVAWKGCIRMTTEWGSRSSRIFLPVGCR